MSPNSNLRITGLSSPPRPIPSASSGNVPSGVQAAAKKINTLIIGSAPTSLSSQPPTSSIPESRPMPRSGSEPQNLRRQGGRPSDSYVESFKKASLSMQDNADRQTWEVDPSARFHYFGSNESKE